MSDETIITCIFALIDDRVQDLKVDPHPGPIGRLSLSEVLTLMVLQPILKPGWTLKGYCRWLEANLRKLAVSGSVEKILEDLCDRCVLGDRGNRGESCMLACMGSETNLYQANWRQAAPMDRECHWYTQGKAGLGPHPKDQKNVQLSSPAQSHSLRLKPHHSLASAYLAIRVG